MRIVLLLVVLSGAALAQSAPTLGDAAPLFKLNDHSGVAREVPAVGSWTVLAFFPRAAAPG